MKSQKGIATLMITTVVVLVSLLITLSYSRSIYYQSKRANNEINSRQNHWLAEGGLECVYMQVRDTFPLVNPLSRCNLSPYLEVTIVSKGDTVYEIGAAQQGTLLKKRFYYSDQLKPVTKPVWIKGSWNDLGQ